MADPHVELAFDVIKSSAAIPQGSGVFEWRVAAPAGKKPFGGGFKVQQTSGDYAAHLCNYPDESTNEWVFEFFKNNNNASAADCYVTVINA